MHIFEYSFEITAQAQLEIENIGEFCIMCNNKLYTHFMICHTEDGVTKIITAGPYNILDTSLPLLHCTVDYNEFQFSESNIKKKINKFLTNSCCSEATEIPFEEVKDIIKNPMEYLYDK